MPIQKKTLMRTGKKANVASKATKKGRVAPKRDFAIRMSKIKVSYLD